MIIHGGDRLKWVIWFGPKISGKILNPFPGAGAIVACVLPVAASDFECLAFGKKETVWNFRFSALSDVLARENVKYSEAEDDFLTEIQLGTWGKKIIPSYPMRFHAAQVADTSLKQNTISLICDNTDWVALILICRRKTRTVEIRRTTSWLKLWAPLIQAPLLGRIRTRRKQQCG